MDEFRQMDVLSRTERKQRINGEEVEDISIVSMEDTISIFNGKDSDTTVFDILTASDLSLDNIVDKQTAIRKLVQAIKKLPLQERLVFSLYCINRYTTYDDIGDILGISTSRVCQLLHKAKQTLKESIKWEE